MHLSSEPPPPPLGNKGHRLGGDGALDISLCPMEWGLRFYISASSTVYRHRFLTLYIASII